MDILGKARRLESRIARSLDPAFVIAWMGGWLALAILLTTWGVLIAGCLTAYFTVRWAMIRQLDQSIELRAEAIPELAAGTATRPSTAATLSHDADRYIIRTNTRQLKVSPPGGGRSLNELVPISAAFDRTADGARWRVVNLRGVVRLSSGEGLVPTPVTVIYFSSAEPLDRLLNRLAVTFTLFGVAAGVVTALVALRVSRTALRPLQATADAIAAI